MKVAFIGLGNMGLGIANCILRAGFDLTVYNRTLEKMQPFLANGARGGADLKDAVKDADVVLTSLMDDQSVLDSLKNGILVGMKPGAIHIGLTTNSPECADEVAKLHKNAGTSYVSGPVVGRPNAAAAGELLSLLAGDKASVDKVEPVCRAYSKKVVYVGERHGAANTLKLCVNYTIISIIEVFSEAYAFADKAGANLDALKDFLEEAMGHPALKMYAGKLRARDFAGRGGFAMSGGFKDVTLMLKASSKIGVSFDIGQIIAKKMEAAIAAGMGEQDWSSIYEITRKNSGLN
jgi:3-hydroxyisobutyrate dehydrogenase-like beta-hydroxyacid dehydrogenase